MLPALLLLASALANPVPALSGRGVPGLNQPTTASPAAPADPRFASPPLWATNPWAWRPMVAFDPPPPPARVPAPEPRLTAWQLRPDRIETPGEVILFTDLPSAFAPIPEATNHLPVDPTAGLVPPEESETE